MINRLRMKETSYWYTGEVSMSELQKPTESVHSAQNFSFFPYQERVSLGAWYDSVDSIDIQTPVFPWRVSLVLIYRDHPIELITYCFRAAVFLP